MADGYRLIISPEASADLQAIQAYIEQRSVQGAASMANRILDAIQKLQILPHRTIFENQSRKIKHPVRSLPVKPYVVYFRVLDDQRVVRILTIRHGARRRPRRFN